MVDWNAVRAYRAALRDLLSRPDTSVAAIARLLGVSRSTLYKHVPELAGGRAALPAASQD